MTGSVLIVDDERGVRRTLEFLLSKEGFRVSVAESGEQAMDRFEERPVDLVLTDLRMDGMSGLDVVREVKRRSPGAEVLVMTAFGSIDTAVEAMKLGATDYITKPARNEEILGRCAKYSRADRLARRMNRATRRPVILGWARWWQRAPRCVRYWNGFERWRLQT